MSRRQDLVIVGGGTGGLVAAVTAAQVGARTTLIERDRTGGDCLWTGCVPSKALLAAAETAQSMRDAGRFGITAVEPEVDFGAVMAHVRDVQNQIAPHDSPERLRGLGVEVVHGDAAFTGPDTVAVGGRTLRFRRAIIATGTAPAVPPVPGLRESNPLTSDSLWELDVLPDHLVVLGGGPIGCELGQAFRRLGSDVTIVEMAGRIIPREDEPASRVLHARLEAEGVTVLADTKAVEVTATHITVERAGEQWDVPYSHLLAATGRTPNSKGLGLEAAGVRTTERGHVEVDGRLRTSNDRIFAAGDITGRLPFTHVASMHGSTAALNALFNLPRTVSEANVPWVTYTHPEIAHVGLSVDDARAKYGDDIIVKISQLADNDRAMAARETDGFSLLVGDPKGRLVGGTIAAPAAGEMITEVVAWLSQGATLSTIGQTTHSYPTFAEATSEAGFQVFRDKVDSKLLTGLTKGLLGTFRLFDRS